MRAYNPPMSNRAARRESYDQPGLFPPDQPDLFGGAAAPRRDVYIPKPDAVRSGARAALETLREIGAWRDIHCWRRITVIERAEYYYRITADDAEADEWRERYEAEFARLDATGPRVTDEERADRYTYPNFPTREFEPLWVRRPPGRV